jgi:hypothetical protein
MRVVAITLTFVLAACSSTPPPSNGDSGTPVVCDGGLRACGGSCSDVALDSQNCGECGHACAAGEACAGGVCYPQSCGALTCPAAFVCLGTVCAERACFGVSCPAGQACGGGMCLPTSCGTTPCAGDQVCVMNACIEASCAGVLCPPGALCSHGICAQNTCGDGIKNGAETDTDCGGICPACLAGQACMQPTDCDSLVCTANACAAASCSDHVRNGGEGDVDCGGSCPPCADGRRCTQGPQCQSLVCTAGSCASPTCMDHEKNGAETDVDCGGGCPTCSNGLTCAIGTDCQSGLCSQQHCISAQCQDGMKDGAETGTDCGGGTCAPCGSGQGCAQGADCLSGVCGTASPRTCQAPSCSDMLKNGTETDVDCGGGSCLACAAGRACAAPGDCQSRICTNGTCAAATCSDGITNGGESDVDCGGLSTGCPRCGFNQACALSTDCLSGMCTMQRCTAPPLFGTPLMLTAPATTGGLAVADVDADGNLDVVATAGYAVVIWWGLGNGTFTALSSWQVPGGAATYGTFDAPRGVAVGDLNGDGKRDLITGSSNSYVLNVLACRATIFNNAGSRGFLPPITVDDLDPMNMLSGCGETITITKLDGDSLVDAVLSDGYTNSDTEAFGAFVIKGSAGTYGPLIREPGPGAYIASGDLNGDGANDVVSHRVKNAQIVPFFGDGMGGLTQGTGIPVAPGTGGVTARDLNADGKPDFIAASSTGNSVAVSLTNAMGQWLASRSYTAPSPTDVVVGDFDRDGKLDIVASSTGLAFFKGHGDGTFDDAVQYSSSSGATLQLMAGDFDGDSKLDVAARTTTGVLVFRNLLP